MSTVRAAAAHDEDVFRRVVDDAPQLAGYSASARRVLAAAAALFHRNGAATTSIRDITAQCGLTPGAFYRHFESKDELLNVLVRLGHERMETRIAAALASDDTGASVRLAAFVRAYVAGHLEQPELAQVVRREYRQLSARRLNAVVRRRRAVRDRLVEILTAGAASGEFVLPGDDADRTRVAVMLLDMCSRTADWYHADSAQTPEQMAHLYVDAALRLAGARA